MRRCRSPRPRPRPPRRRWTARPTDPAAPPRDRRHPVRDGAFFHARAWGRFFVPPLFAAPPRWPSFAGTARGKPCPRICTASCI
ncbi:hypothetical protein HMPREF0731_3835 [Pseudoroseomonas cervicalis ATCC 49957]|uniref:Uncharacterized protein n=1 Tax=Pseudoroseomonas cervicalis ATCC 49957 TaxID=525371 RepID=D5RRX3_9PROT|nr:hypothetical protein HMPREF0731_3835 [Pseudoroseomonas cervicalis ATCC 49957]